MTGAVSLLAFAVGGLLLGVVYFALLRQSVDLFVGGRGRGVPAVLTLGRFVGIALFFAAAARLGALPLLGTFLGFLVARGFAVRGARRAV